MISMTCWLPANSVMISVQLFLYRTGGLEHPQHAVGDEESADHVAGGGDDGNHTKNCGELALVLSYEHDCAHDCDGVKGVGQRHQRRVQEGRDVADNFESDEGRQHENEECVD